MPLATLAIRTLGRSAFRLPKEHTVRHSGERVTGRMLAIFMNFRRESIFTVGADQRWRLEFLSTQVRDTPLTDKH